jgi:hypothetical protein
LIVETINIKVPAFYAGTFMFDVSDKAIEKRCKRLNVVKPLLVIRIRRPDFSAVSLLMHPPGSVAQWRFRGERSCSHGFPRVT